MTVDDGTDREWPAVLTWRSHDLLRMESTRVNLSGKRIKAVGRIVSAASEFAPSFSASYDLVTDDTGATTRLSLNVSLAERDRQMSIARDEENMWLVTGHEGESRSGFEGALDVDLVFSPFFNALPIRRLDLHREAGDVTVPVLYVSLPDLAVRAAEISYASAGPDGDTLTLVSPVADTTIVIDADGFILDYPGLATRI